MSNDSKAQQSASDSAQNQKPAPTLLSWTVRGISLAFIVSIIGYFIWSAAQPDVHPTFTFEVEQEKIEQRGTGWAMPVNITNTGLMSVHALEAVATLTGVGGKQEENVNIVLLGPNESVTATFWFDQNPRDKGVEFSVGSYLLP